MSAPAAQAVDGDVVVPLAQAPVGGIVRAVWDDTMLAEGTNGAQSGLWYASTDHGDTWAGVDLGDSELATEAKVQYIDSTAAVLTANPPGGEDTEVTPARAWVVDLSGATPTVTTHDVDAKSIGAATRDLVIAVDGDDDSARAISLSGGSDVALQTEVADPDSWSWWATGADGVALHVNEVFSDSFTVSSARIDPVPLDGSSTGARSFTVTGEVDHVGFTSTGAVEYISLHKTKGASTFQFDYCTVSGAGSTPTCDVLKTKISKNDAMMSFGRKLGDFAQLEVGSSLYVTKLVRAAGTGKFPATVKVTGVAPDQGDLTHTEFARVGRSDLPVVSDTTPTSGGVFEVAASGKASRFSQGPLGPVVPEQLSLAPSRMAGLDGRARGTAWQRTLAAPTTETTLSERGLGVLVSAGRTAVQSSDGLLLLDRGTQVAKLAKWAYLGELSGPYVLGYASAKASKPSVLAGTTPITFGKWDYPYALFGGLVATISYTDTSWEIRVWDIRSGKPQILGAVPIDEFQELDGVFLWGDNVAVTGSTDSDTTAAKVTDFRTGTVVWSRSSDDGLWLTALSDGVAVVETGESSDWQAVDLAASSLTELSDSDANVAPALDAAGHALYATGSELVVHDLGFGGTSAPRALWTSAAATFNSWAGDTAGWKLSVDATKALPEGSLVISAAGKDATVVPVDASVDGSLRITWDGTIAGVPAEEGTYSWHLEGFGGLVDLTAAGAVSGTVTITNTATTYPQATPKLDVTKPAVGAVVTADPGPVPTDVTPTFQWYRGSSAIKGATAADYTVVAADLGKTLKAKVSVPASKYYRASSKTSAATAKVIKGTLAKGAAALSCDAPQVDVACAVDATGWGPVPVTVGYQWYRVDAKGKAKAISKATKASYVPTGADVGYGLKTTVTGSRSGYTSASTTSTVSAKVIAGSYAEVGTLAITGDAVVGRTLVADPGRYQAAGGATVVPVLSYQWYRVTDAGDVAIKGSTKVTYKVASADLGLALKVKVVAQRPGYADVTTWSEPSDPVVVAG
ncbi:hypothetical protein [Propionicimonas sp.]|uniref:hypothetical protein n=1 Tax=Propionicimonas sp. TaxID=1955623 RepID=UPI003D12C363